MSLSREEIEHIAALAHLDLQAGEIEHLSRQLSAVVDHITRLQELDLENVEPTTGVITREDVLREDVVEASWPVARILANAPAVQSHLFEVQAVLD